jgi:hypothetical protein
MNPLAALSRHPFAVAAHFDFSLVLTYALPATTLAPLLPPMLELDTFHDVTGFVAIAMVQTRGLRPQRLPSWFGRDFFLVGTRIFVRFARPTGGHLRGLYILRSQTDSRAMRALGDVFTRYRYEPLDVAVTRTPERIHVAAGAFDVDVDTRPVTNGDGDDSDDVDSDGGSAGLPAGSPFATWKEARRFAGPMPHTFSALSDDEVLIVEGVRENWRPRPVRVTTASVPFFAERGLAGPALASAFLIEDVPYRWKPGRRERWSKP